MRFVLTTWFGLARHDNCSTLSLVLFVLHSLTLPCAAAQVLPSSETLLGLPRGAHCAFAYNQTLYIMGGNMSDSNQLISLTMSADISHSRPTMARINTMEQLNETNMGCAVTSYGHALFLPTFLVLDLQSRQWVSLPPTIIEYGSALLLRSINDTGSLTSAMWNDLFLVVSHFGGSNHTEYGQTYVLDTRQRDDDDDGNNDGWTWNPIPVTSDAPSLPTVAMTATQHWIAHLSAEPIYDDNNSSSVNAYNVSVHCFDPNLMLWLGLVGHFVSPTDQLRATSYSGDQVLVMTAHTDAFSSSSENSRVVLPHQYGLWRLNLSSDYASQPQGTIHYMPPSEVGPFRSLSGQSLTRVADNFLVMYGGLPLSHDSLRFWNGSTLSFIYPTWWRETQLYPTYPTPEPEPTTTNNDNDTNRLGIILGTVLGGLFFLLLLLICFCCWKRRRRRQHDNSDEQPSFSAVPQRMTLENHEDSRTWAAHLGRALSSIRRSPRHASAEEEVPTMAATRYDNPPDMVYHPESAIDIERQNQIRGSSRFNEHFDLIALPDSISRDSRL